MKKLLITFFIVFVIGLIWVFFKNEPEHKILREGDAFPTKEFVKDIQDIVMKNNTRYFMYRYVVHDKLNGNVMNLILTIDSDSIILNRLKEFSPPQSDLEIVFKDEVQYVDDN